VSSLAAVMCPVQPDSLDWIIVNYYKTTSHIALTPPSRVALLFRNLFLHVVRTTRFHCGAHNSRPHLSILNDINPVHTIPVSFVQRVLRATAISFSFICSPLIFGQEYKLWIPSLRNLLHPPPTSCVWGITVLLSLPSDTHSVQSCLTSNTIFHQSENRQTSSHILVVNVYQ
jgi:hypothetical protein